MSSYVQIMHQWLTPSEAARQLHVHPETLRRRSNELPNGCVEVTEGGHRRYRSDLLAPFAPAVQELHPSTAAEPPAAEGEASDKLRVWNIAWAAEASGICSTICPGDADDMQARAAFHALDYQNVFERTGKINSFLSIAPSVHPSMTAEEFLEKRERELQEAAKWRAEHEVNMVRMKPREVEGDLVERGRGEQMYRVVWNARMRGVASYLAISEESAQTQFEQEFKDGRLSTGWIDVMSITMLSPTDNALGLRPSTREFGRVLSISADIRRVADEGEYRPGPISAMDYEGIRQEMADQGRFGDLPASASLVRKYVGSWDSAMSLIGRSEDVVISRH